MAFTRRIPSALERSGRGPATLAGELCPNLPRARRTVGPRCARPGGVSDFPAPGGGPDRPGSQPRGPGPGRRGLSADGPPVALRSRSEPSDLLSAAALREPGQTADQGSETLLARYRDGLFSPRLEGRRSGAPRADGWRPVRDRHGDRARQVFLSPRPAAGPLVLAITGRMGGGSPDRAARKAASGRDQGDGDTTPRPRRELGALAVAGRRQSGERIVADPGRRSVLPGSRCQGHSLEQALRRWRRSLEVLEVVFPQKSLFPGLIIPP